MSPFYLSRRLGIIQDMQSPLNTKKGGNLLGDLGNKTRTIVALDGGREAKTGDKVVEKGMCDRGGFFRHGVPPLLAIQRKYPGR